MTKRISTLIALLDSEKLISEIAVYDDIECSENITDNSQNVQNGDVFICKGAEFREEYLEEAIDAGICVYISEKKYTDRIPSIIVNDIRRSMSIAGRWFYDCPGDRLVKIGVTGTKGKTSCVSMISDITRAAKIRTAEFTTHNIRIKDHMYESALTTPEPLALQRYFKEAVDDGVNIVAMEISSQAMKMKRVYGEQYRIGIFLNIEEDHISPTEHADMEEYLKCKVEMLSQCDTVIINRDTAMYDQIRQAVSGDTEVILYGQESYDHDVPDALVRNVKMDSDGLVFDMTYRNVTIKIRSNLIGRFNVENITAAVITGIELGIDMDTVCDAIRDVFIPGRLNMLDVAGRHVIIDYAHNHLSYDRLFRTIRGIYPGSVMRVMVGAAGSKAYGRRREAGQMSDVYADSIMITEQDCADENPMKIGMEIAKYIHKPYSIVPKREQAIKRLLDDSDPGDVVVLTGKGAEKTLRIGRNTTRPYKGDYEIVRMWVESTESNNE